MLRSLTRKRLLVPAFALAAFVAVHGAAGAYPGDDYTGDYSEPYWIYANPAARAVDQPRETEGATRGGGDATLQTSPAGEEPCGSHVPIPVPPPDDEPFPIEDQTAACGL